MTGNLQLTTGNFIWALGLMSGTSLDGVDAALIRTDGETIADLGQWLTLPYDDAMRGQLAAATRREGDLAATARDVTLWHGRAVKQLLEESKITPSIIGFHGQTIDHRPDEGITWQLGDGALLAAETGIDVVADFRSRDVAEGGQGAPLVPLFHAALVRDLPRPLAVLNIGGIANVTYIGETEAQLLAFDTGTGCGLMNQLAEKALGAPYDEGGALAARGRVHEAALAEYLAYPYFAKKPPKSLDRHDFTLAPLANLPAADAMATLLEFTAQGVVRALDWLPQPPLQWLVVGGGVHNPVLMARLKEMLAPSREAQSASLPSPINGGGLGWGHVMSVNDIGWQPDAIEAQAFGFLAVRSLRGLPLTLPHLTGARRAVPGGAFYRGADAAHS